MVILSRTGRSSVMSNVERGTYDGGFGRARGVESLAGGESTSMRRGGAVDLFILDPVALDELVLIMTSKVELS
jgi:hypothetical protein